MNIMKNKARIIFWLSMCLGTLGISIVLFITAKTYSLKASQVKIGDGGFLTGEPCGPPCFLGIIPGVTKETEAIQILKEKGLYKNCDYVNNESESGLRGFGCSNFLVNVSFFRGTDVVGSIGFTSARQVTIDMIIKKYGEPDSVLVSSNWFNWEPEPTTSMSLVYDDIKANIGLGEQQGSKFTITSTTIIKWVDYSDPTFPSITENESWKKFLSSWHGYGEYVDANP